MTPQQIRATGSRSRDRDPPRRRPRPGHRPFPSRTSSSVDGERALPCEEDAARARSGIASSARTGRRGAGTGGHQLCSLTVAGIAPEQSPRAPRRPRRSASPSASTISRRNAAFLPTESTRSQRHPAAGRWPAGWQGPRRRSRGPPRGRGRASSTMRQRRQRVEQVEPRDGLRLDDAGQVDVLVRAQQQAHVALQAVQRPRRERSRAWPQNERGRTSSMARARRAAAMGSAPDMEMLPQVAFQFSRPSSVGEAGFRIGSDDARLPYSATGGSRTAILRPRLCGDNRVFHNRARAIHECG